MTEHVIKGNKGRSFNYGDNPSGGLVRSLNKKTKLTNNSGTYTMCAYCGVSFRRPACHLARTAVPCCGKACAAAIRVINIETSCVICSKIFLVKPSGLGRKITCSKECSSIRRTKGTPPSIRSLVRVKLAIKEIKKKGECFNCRTKTGPWAVRNIDAIWEKGVTEVDISKTELWCKHCHLKDVAPLGSIVRDGKYHKNTTS